MIWRVFSNILDIFDAFRDSGKLYRAAFIYNMSSDGGRSLESGGWEEGRTFVTGITDQPLSGGSGSTTDVITDLRDEWHVKDHIGGVRAVIDITPVSDGQQAPSLADRILEQNDYLPFGTKIDGLTYASSTTNRWRYAGKEEQVFGLPGANYGTTCVNLDLLDFGGRYYDSFIGRWTTIDPMATSYTSWSEYNYCLNNPLFNTDFSGLSTNVVLDKKVFYRVIGGDLSDNDKSIYLYSTNDRGCLIKGDPIGETPTLFSFYNKEKEEWNVNAIINPKDMSGIDFLKKIESGVDVFSYVLNYGREYHLYDFKHSNADPSHVGKANALNNVDRGMPIGENRKGVVIYASARDIGNIGAGLVSVQNAISWITARMAMDTYQSFQDINASSHLTLSRESITSRSAQFYGWFHPQKIGRDIRRYEKNH